MVPLYSVVFKCISNAPCILSRNFGSRSRMASFHSCGIPRLFKTHSNYREFRSSFRKSASGLEIVHSRWQSAHAEVDRWCTAGACRACRESRCTMVNVSPPLPSSPPTFPPFSPPHPAYRDSCTELRTGLADVRVASEPRQPWTCRCWLTRLGRLPTRSSYERKGVPPPLSISHRI